MQLTSTVHKILFPPTLHRLIISHHGEPRFGLGCGVGWPNDSIMSSVTQILFIFLLSPFQYIGSLSGWLLSRPQITINNNWRRMLRCSLLTGSFTQKPRKNSLLVLHWFKLAYFSLFPNHHLFCAASKKLKTIGLKQLRPFTPRLEDHLEFSLCKGFESWRSRGRFIQLMISLWSQMLCIFLSP